MGSDAKWWISEIASCARRFGRNPYEHGLKSASKIGSSTAFRLAWTTRSATVGIPSLRNFPVTPFGIITCRTSTGRNSPDFSESRIWPRNTSTPTRASIRATVARSMPGVRCPGVPGHTLPRVDQECRVIDEVIQVTEPAGGIFSRPAVQLDLHPPYREVRRIGMRPLHSAGIHQRIFGH